MGGGVPDKIFILTICTWFLLNCIKIHCSTPAWSFFFFLREKKKTAKMFSQYNKLRLWWQQIQMCPSILLWEHKMSQYVYVTYYSEAACKGHMDYGKSQDNYKQIKPYRALGGWTGTKAPQP